MKILMVCLGNICRSPMAEGIMKVKMEERTIDGWVDSAGIADYHEGEHPDYRAVNTSSEYGVDISTQVSRPFRMSDLSDFDYIFTMDAHVHQWILTKAAGNQDLKKVHLFLKYAGLAKGNDNDVPDPYYGGVLEFRKVFGILERCCEHALNRMISEKNG